MTTSANPKLKERLFSLDTLRGFDMFWIMGGEALIISLAKATGWGWMESLAKQMHHVPWEGFHFYDLIFPLFMFMSGVAIPFALLSRLEKGVPKRDVVRKITKRAILLFLFGIVYNGALQKGFSDMRVLSVLSQIGFAYFFASLIVINTGGTKARIFWGVVILVIIAILQNFVPVPGFGAGNFTPEGTINAWIDQHFLPGRLIYKYYDPEGILCIVSATTVTLAGALAGTILRNKEYAIAKKMRMLLASGAGLIALALALSPVYPIIKNVWTVPFNLLTAGISFLLMATFYYIIDVKKWRGWIFFFQVIGLNSITIYMGQRMINFKYSSEFLLGWLSGPAGDFGIAIIIAGAIALKWLFLYYLYKNKIFLKV